MKSDLLRLGGRLARLFLLSLATVSLIGLPVCQAQSVAGDASTDSVPSALPVVEPAQLGVSQRRLQIIEEIVQEGLDRKQMPGCVVLIGYQGHVVYHRAFGHRQLQPEPVPMELDTVFDLASLTKPVATATSVMKLIEQGHVEPDAAVAQYLPEFAANGKDTVTVRQLLTHTGGLIPDNSINDYKDGPEVAFQKIHQLSLQQAPGEKFVYTDVGFIVLAELVKRVSGQNIHEFSQQHLFQPLGMTETGYLPAAELQQRTAVTEQRDGVWMQGQVHDPRAFALGGVAGHAGLFSTAADLARYAQMLVNGGRLQDVRVLEPATVALMTEPQPVSSGFRTCGWDLRSPYSSNRGDLMSAAAFGHGGFTGTAMWIDPPQQLFVIFLSNRLHPDGSGSVNALAGRIGTIAAAAIPDR